MSTDWLDRFLAGENALKCIDPPLMAQTLSQYSRAPLLRLHVALGSQASKELALEALSIAFDMPRWFGHNWDALADCLTDLEWLPDQPIVLMLEGALKDEGDAETLMDILQEACDYWQQEGRGFHVLTEARPAPNQGLSG